MAAIRPVAGVGECQACGRTTAYACSACTSTAYYCCPQHLVKAWNDHSFVCDAVHILTAEKAATYSLAYAASVERSKHFARDALSPETHKLVSGPANSTSSLVDGELASGLVTALSLAGDHAASGLSSNSLPLASDQTVSGLSTDGSSLPDETVAAGPPSHEARFARAIYADALTEELTFVDVPVIPRDIGDHIFEYGWAPFLVRYLQDPAARTVITCGADLRPLSSPLVVYFSTDEFRYKDMVNASLAVLTSGMKPAPKPWYGPIIIMKATSYPPTDFCDIDYCDLATVCAFFGRGGEVF